MANRLKDETSPYLLQHQNNPVDWRPWGVDALEEAKATDRAILLSVGYAACHWCHVMAHESFENPAIAALMNQLFIPVKVDREERPDLDAIYQQALGLMGQHGGWPLTMFLTPDGLPFWGGTYFPPTARWGRAGFGDVLKGVADVWANRRDQALESVSPLLERLTRSGAPAAMGASAALTLDVIDHYATLMIKAVDSELGGLEGAPKFPHCGFFDRLWRSGLRNPDPALKDAVQITLDKMCNGGIYDHLGGGLMRYSTDAEWLVPHFEKMLYDNAQLIELLTLVWQSEPTALTKTRVTEIIGWTLREMMAEGQAFAATLDADDPKGEGHFYTWTESEIDAVLGANAPAFKAHYDVTAHGNWEGRTILRRVTAPLGDAGEAALAEARAALFVSRETKERPGRDDKVLADWNGMMVAAMANAGFVFNRADWIEAAQTAYDTVAETMDLGDDRLAHSACLGRVSTVGLLDDLAHMARAALMLYEVTAQPRYLNDAARWGHAIERHHLDQTTGGYCQNHHGATDVIARLKPTHDNAVPAANGIVMEVFAKLYLQTKDPVWQDRAWALADLMTPSASRAFAHMTAFLSGVELLLDPVEIKIGGPKDDPVCKALLDVVAATPLPTRVIQWDRSTPGAQVCRRGTCHPGVSTATDLQRLLTDD